MQRATELLKTQVDSLKGDGTALVASFRPDAVVLVPDPRLASGPNVGLRDAIDQTGPQDSVKKIALGKVVAGGNATAVWLNATIDITVGKPRTVRVTELMAAPDWKVVAAAFTDSRSPNMMDSAPDAVPSATSAGVLAPLLAKPGDLDAAIGSDPGLAVFGTDAKEIAFGAEAAHKMLTGWNSLPLSVEGAPREVREASWGYAQANVNWNKPGDRAPTRLSAMLIAVPGPDGKWSVVAASYSGL
jgi:hypothetical protein